MTLVQQYRSAVIYSVACPACLAQRGKPCTKLESKESKIVRDVPQVVEYVHDDRSHAFDEYQMRSR